MLESIDIINFETHLGTKFDLHPCVNVIVGESDEGKSGIVRAIKWNASNRPQGDEYRNDQLDPKKKEDKLKATQVGIAYKNSGLVVRARDGFAGGINHYQIDTQEPLRALRTDVPDEVREVSKMKDVNVQGQHPTEQYFLLADKPGQVAKEFNKVAGLTIMDKATAEINSRIRTCNTEIKISKKTVEDTQEEIDNTEWVDAAEKLAIKLEDFQAKIAVKDEEYNYLLDIITHIEEITDVLDHHFQGLDWAIESLKELKKENQDIEDQQNTLNVLNRLIFDMKNVDLKLSDTADLKKALNVLNELKMSVSNIEEKQKKLDSINVKIKEINKNTEILKIAENELTEANTEYDLIRTNEACPTCGRKGE